MQGFKLPKQLATGLFTDIIVPSITQNGYGAVWNDSTKKIEWAQFEALGAVASGIATHVALLNPHSQYQLISGLGSAAYQNTGAFDSAGAATTAINNHIAAANPHTQYPLSSSLGTAAYLNVGTSANNIVQLNGSGFLPALNGSLLTNLPITSPGGSSGYIQYNNAGTFGASGVYWNSANSRMGVNNSSPTHQMVVGSGTTSSVDGTFKFLLTHSSDARFGAAVNNVVAAIYTGGTYAAVYGYNYGNGTPVSLALNQFGGNVGIGTTSPGQKLDVNGSVNVATALIVPVVRPASDSTTAWKVTKADGTTSVITVDTTNSRVGIGTTSPSAWLHLPASTTAAASLRIPSGTAPTSPNDGDIWFDGTNYRCRVGGVTKTFTVA